SIASRSGAWRRSSRPGGAGSRASRRRSPSRRSSPTSRTTGSSWTCSRARPRWWPGSPTRTSSRSSTSGRSTRPTTSRWSTCTGGALGRILKQARDEGLRLPLDLSLRIVGQVCSALEYAHRKKDNQGRPMEIVHRDVSPQNILISFEGDVKLTDFGIAKAATKASSTDRGALRGKLLYMSPEQAWGGPIDRRSDIFSLGIVLYEIITDHKPFLGACSEASILELVRKCQIPPPCALNPRIPEALENVTLKALARNADDRYQDAGEMQRGLEWVLRERQPPAAGELARFME